jgi:hypothetical protein
MPHSLENLKKMRKRYIYYDLGKQHHQGGTDPYRRPQRKRKILPRR